MYFTKILSSSFLKCNKQCTRKNGESKGMVGRRENPFNKHGQGRRQGTDMDTDRYINLDMNRDSDRDVDSTGTQTRTRTKIQT
jgi:hypothetical protein